MMLAQKIDFKSIPVLEVARELLGDESRERSTSTEKHFPDHGGLFVNVNKNRWYSHGNGTGGDALNLICHVKGCDPAAGISWLKSHGHIQQPQPQTRRLIATYDYVDQNGIVRYHIGRCEPKSFRQWREIDGERINGVVAGLYEKSRFNGGGWYRVKDKPRLGAETRTFPAVEPVPYRLPELLQSGNAAVLIPGGEKDVDNLRALGFTATTNHGGEGHWWPELSQWLRDRRVFILCDNDKQGETHQAKIGAALSGIAREIRLVRFPELPEGKDVSDLIEKRRRDGRDDTAIKKELTERFRNAPTWEPAKSETSNASVSDDWPIPVSLPEGLSPVDCLDTDLLPTAIAPWVCDISERMQCPPDYVGTAALTALGSVLGRKVGIAPEQHTDWYEVANLWNCIVGRSGLMKSPAIGEALKLLHRLEASALETYDNKHREHCTEWQLWKLRSDAAEQAAKTTLKNNPKATFDLGPPEPQEPVERRYVTNDTSYEKLGELLAQNPNGILAHRDELVSLLKTLDREENAAARGFFLTAWNGKDRYTFDRIVRGKTRIEGVCLSLLGSTQPSRLAEYVRRAITSDTGDDGLRDWSAALATRSTAVQPAGE
jgi:5S rRNA maturation endonuclease (ribonuclease M5)